MPYWSDAACAPFYAAFVDLRDRALGFVNDIVGRNGLLRVSFGSFLGRNQVFGARGKINWREFYSFWFGGISMQDKVFCAHLNRKPCSLGLCLFLTSVFVLCSVGALKAVWARDGQDALFFYTSSDRYSLSEKTKEIGATETH